MNAGFDLEWFFVGGWELIVWPTFTTAFVRRLRVSSTYCNPDSQIELIYAMYPEVEWSRIQMREIMTDVLYMPTLEGALKVLYIYNKISLKWLYTHRRDFFGIPLP